MHLSKNKFLANCAQMFEAVILAGGLGTRLTPVTSGGAKALVEVAGEPFLYKVMRSLESGSCHRIVLALGYKAQEIIDNVQRDRPVNCQVDFVVEGQQLGTGGAIVNAAKYVSSHSFLVVNGDTLCGIDYKNFYMTSLDSACRVAVCQVENADRYGRISIDSNSGRVLAFEEKGFKGPGLISVGVYFISKDFLPQSDHPFSIERDLFMHNTQTITTYGAVKGFVDIGMPDDYYWACANSETIESWM